MRKHRILIVDDQRDIRHVFRSALATLDPDIQVVDVPSGEEAMLVISVQPFDILVADVGLPGISGLELKRRAELHNPDMKLILITGITDWKVKEQVASAGADYFFYKPIPMEEFLSAIKDCLQTPQGESAEEPSAEEPEPGHTTTPTLAERLSSLRGRLGARSVLLLDDRGNVVALAGETRQVENGFIPGVMGVLSAGERLSNNLGTRPPQTLSEFRSAEGPLFLAHVGSDMGLVIALDPDTPEDTYSQVSQEVRAVVEDVLKLVTPAGLEDTSQQQSVPEDLAISPEVPASIGEPAEADEPALDEDALRGLEEIFQGAEAQSLATSDVDEFWESLADEAGIEGVSRPDILTYEQARRLGLAPDEEL